MNFKILTAKAEDIQFGKMEKEKGVVVVEADQLVVDKKMKAGCPTLQTGESFRYYIVPYHCTAPSIDEVCT